MHAALHIIKRPHSACGPFGQLQPSKKIRSFSYSRHLQVKGAKDFGDLISRVQVLTVPVPDALPYARIQD